MGKLVTRGLAYFTGVGLRHFFIELLYFLPFTLYALRPRRLRLRLARPPAGRFVQRR